MAALYCQLIGSDILACITDQSTDLLSPAFQLSRDLYVQLAADLNGIHHILDFPICRTVKSYFEFIIPAWMPGVHLPPNRYIRESSAVYYKIFIDTHIRPKLDDIKPNQLQTMDIQRLYNELRENGRIRKEIRDKQPRLSVSYIRGMHNMLKACLNSAVEERTDPEKSGNEVQVAESREKGNEGADPGAAWKLPRCPAKRGLRKRELVPLLWSDVDTNNMTISISKQAYHAKGALTVQPPKADNSMWRIALSAETMKLLKQEL